MACGCGKKRVRRGTLSHVDFHKNLEKSNMQTVTSIILKKRFSRKIPLIFEPLWALNSYKKSEKNQRTPAVLIEMAKIR